MWPSGLRRWTESAGTPFSREAGNNRVLHDARFLTEICDGLPTGYERVHRVDQRFLGAGSEKILKSNRGRRGSLGAVRVGVRAMVRRSEEHANRCEYEARENVS